MKMLFVSSAHPEKKSGSNTYVSNLVKYMRKNSKIEFFWIVFEKSRILESKNEEEKILEIREFSDGLDIIEKIEPDIILAINNRFDPLQCSISIAAKYKKIPLIHFKIIEKIEDDISSRFQMKKISTNFKRLLNEETELEKNTIRNKISFILYKHSFLNKTRKKTGTHFLKNFLLFCNDISSYFQEKQRMYVIADLQLVNNKSWYDLFKKIGFKEENLALTGSPYWDPIFEKLKKYDLEQDKFQEKIKVLIITSPLVEHGYGTYSERNSFLKEIFDELKKKEIEFALKIHPSSENKISYQEFLKRDNLKIPIFQNEKLWELINDFNVVLTYGYGYPQIECAFGGIRTILLSTKWEFPEIPIVVSAIDAGYYRKCEKINEIGSNIENLMSKKIKITEEIIQERENICYKFDGKSSERATNAILKIVQNKVNSHDKV